jgi:hypothetical protein
MKGHVVRLLVQEAAALHLQQVQQNRQHELSVFQECYRQGQLEALPCTGAPACIESRCPVPATGITTQPTLGWIQKTATFPRRGLQRTSHVAHLLVHEAAALDLQSGHTTAKSMVQP